MFSHKKHLFFDLDHTLWDYETSSDETLRDLYTSYQLQTHGVELNNFLTTFSAINGALWDRFHAGEIDKDVIRVERFPAIFKELDLVNNISLAEAMQDEYIQVCPTKPYLIADALEVLESLKGRYKLHIITNGFEEIQAVKLRSGGITDYFEQIITSGMAGSQKPERAIFDYALAKAGADAGESIMVGDNPLSDIEGAFLAGIDQVFYNPNHLTCAIKPTLEITSLRQLLQYL